MFLIPTPIKSEADVYISQGSCFEREIKVNDDTLEKWTLWNGTKNKLSVLTFWLKPHNTIYVIPSRYMILLVCWEFWLKGNYTLGE